MKTEEFYIVFDYLDAPMSTTLRISKTEYKRQLAFLMDEVKRTTGAEYPLEYRSYTQDTEKTVLTQHFFTRGTAETILTAYGCKPGYHFK